MKLFFASLTLALLSTGAFAQVPKMTCEDRIFDYLGNEKGPIMKQITNLTAQADKAEDKEDKVLEKKLRAQAQSILEGMYQLAETTCKK